MVVQHNLMAMNSNRMLGITTGSQAKSTEKLSSGYKINRAADDAAGLSISEKMRKQIRGLSQASLNASDGISAVQTAEGALNEVQDMLQRMNELAVKASNGTMSENDRTYIQNEIDQLVTEIDRVSETTKFNETYLLKGDGEAVAEKEITYKDLGANKAVAAKITDENGDIVKTTAATDTKTGVTTLNLGDLKNVKAGDSITIDGITYKFIDGTGATPSDETPAAGQTEIDIDINKNGSTAPKTKRTTDELAEAIVSQIKKMNTAATTAKANDGNILNVNITKSAIDGTYTLTAESKTDVARAKTTNTETYTTNAGVVLKTENNMDIADGDIITLGKVELRGTVTTATGTDQALGNANYEINLEDYTGDALSFVYDATDKVWNATNADGTVESFTSLELKEMGIGIKAKDENTAKTEGLFALNDNTKGIADATLADGFTLTIKKVATIESQNTDLVKDANVSMKGLDLSKYEVGDEIKVQANVTVGGTITFTDVEKEPEGIKALHFALQVGADTTEENKISVDIESMSAKSLTIEGIKVDGKDSKNADAAVETIAEAIQKVSTQRSALGAVQNRLEHTIANLDNVVENTTAAESQIRDTDMATEMVKYSNNNILAQAGQAMLAQANQANQGVLSLLG